MTDRVFRCGDAGGEAESRKPMILDGKGPITTSCDKLADALSDSSDCSNK